MYQAIIEVANVLALPHVSILPSEFLTCPPHFLASVGLFYPHEQFQLSIVNKDRSALGNSHREKCGTFGNEAAG